LDPSRLQRPTVREGSLAFRDRPSCCRSPPSGQLHAPSARKEHSQTRAGGDQEVTPLTAVGLGLSRNSAACAAYWPSPSATQTRWDQGRRRETTRWVQCWVPASATTRICSTNWRVDILGSANRHGIDPSDVDHALRHALVVEEVGEDPLRYPLLGPDAAGNMLDLVVMDRPQGPAVIHAMQMQAQYERLLGRGKASR